MGYQDLVYANFEIVQTGLYTLTELENMVPYEWEIHLNLVKSKQERKNKLIGEK